MSLAVEPTQTLQMFPHLQIPNYTYEALLSKQQNGRTYLWETIVQSTRGSYQWGGFRRWQQSSEMQMQDEHGGFTSSNVAERIKEIDSPLRPAN